MAAPKAPLLDASGKKSKDVTLEADVFAVEVKRHLVHEVVRAELNARRAGTMATKSRGLVSGGRSKPWRQKGTGRARAGTIRAAQFTGGGHAFAKVPRTFIQKVNKKAAKAALRSALASHATGGSFARHPLAAPGDPGRSLGRHHRRQPRLPRRAPRRPSIQHLGFALRFPRFVSYRPDKSSYDATTVIELKHLFEQQKVKS